MEPVTEQTNQENTQNEKLFTQEEVNKIMQNRIARYADYEDLKQKATEYDSMLREVNSLKSYKEASEKRMEGVLENLLSSIPEDKRGLIPSEYNTLAKISYIQTNNAFFNTKVENIKETPVVVAPPTFPPKENVSKDVNVEFGGYKSLYEWAMTDPAGYKKAKKEGKIK